MFKKIESEDTTKHDGLCSSSKAEIIINESDIDDVLQSIYATTITNIQKSLGKALRWIIDSVIDHTVSTLKYNPLAGSSFIKLAKELHHSRKDLINISNDSEWFKWCLVRNLNHADHKSKKNYKSW